MIKNVMRLKALVKNRAGGDVAKAQTLLRLFMMKRFLERLSVSKYRDHFIIKGGVLVTSMLGLETRTTMDVDAMV